MKLFRLALAFVACACIHWFDRPCHAIFHLWDIKEVFSNHNGTVQFIELFTTSPDEIFLLNHALTATSDGVRASFTLNHDLSGSSANRHLLFATAGFAALGGGVTPDYQPLPANFFNPNAASITINFAGVDSVTFAGATLPKNGVNSLTDQSPARVQNLVSGVNAPTTYGGATGSVNVPPLAPLAGDFNENGSVNSADLVLWRTGFATIGAAATHMQGNADGDADVDGADFLVWQRQLSPAATVPAATVVPEPPTLALLLMVAAKIACGSRERGTGAIEAESPIGWAARSGARTIDSKSEPQ